MAQNKNTLKMRQTILLLFSITLLISCQSPNSDKTIADTILINGNFYTVDEENPNVEALAIKEDKILALGTTTAIQAFADEQTKVIDLEGKFAMPGFIEGHAHFSGLGESLMNLNFLKSENWEEIVGMVAKRSETTKTGEWITGRGWHQEKWTSTPDRQVLGYPYHDELSAISPDNPVVLRHASGHSLFANKKAMELAGVTAETPNPIGGEIVRDNKGEAIGVFEERAMKIIMSGYNDYLATLNEEEQLARWHEAIKLAEQDCLTKGITSFQDAGSTLEEVKRYTKLAEAGELDVRLWAMIRQPYSEIKDEMQGFPLIGVGNNFFTVRSIKAAIDGALGAFGAWLLRSYEDKNDFEGQNTTPITELKDLANLAVENDMQFCVHAIGDRGNRMVLNLYETVFEENPEKENLRWRIEHAQHLDTSDIPRFKQLGVIASMQGIHCTSDAPFVVKRLGEERARYGAYPWRALIDAGAVVTNGTDAPVEDLSALESFYASVTRRRMNPNMEFFPDQRMTRAEAIHSYTLACAYSAFEENIKGSLKVGKLADVVVLSNDLISCSDEAILDTKILLTMVGGTVKFEQ